MCKRTSLKERNFFNWVDLYVNNKGLKLQTAKKKVEIKKLQKCLQEKQKKLKHSIMNIWKLGNWPVIFSKTAKKTGLTEWVLENLQKDVPLLLVLMKLKLGLFNRNLGMHFGINYAFASKIFFSWIFNFSLINETLFYALTDTVC